MKNVKRARVLTSSLLKFMRSRRLREITLLRDYIRREAIYGNSSLGMYIVPKYVIAALSDKISEIKSLFAFAYKRILYARVLIAYAQIQHVLYHAISPSMNKKLASCIFGNYVHHTGYLMKQD